MKTLSLVEAVTDDILKIIYERRAIRKYKNTPIGYNQLETILAAGRMAPSAMNKQPWKFYILTHKETIRSFSKAIRRSATRHLLKAGLRQWVKMAADFIQFSHKPGFFKSPDPIFHGAPVVVFIAAPRDNEWAALDIGMCGQNMMLAAKSLGLDSCPVGFGKFVEQTRLFTRLNVAATDQVHLAIVFGYGDECPEIPQRMEENAFYVDPVSIF